MSTLRYYERTGILEPDQRSDSNYRLYTGAALQRLRFIRAAKQAGFTLDDISTLLDVQDGVSAPCKEVEHLIEHRLDELDRHLADLKNVRKTLTSLGRLCEDAEDKEHCEVLDQLSTPAAKE